MKPYIVIFSLLWPSLIFSQEQITLEFLLKHAGEAHPRQGDLATRESIYENEIRNLQVNWYPDLEVNGKASYQSDVIEIDLAAPQGMTFPGPSKDQYRMSLDIRQTLYDAGVTKQKKTIAETESIVDKTEIEVDLWNDQKVVLDLFYQYLIMQENERILELSIKELTMNSEVVSTAVESGAILQSELKLIQLQKMELQQELDNLESSRDALLEVLNRKTGVEISPSDTFYLTDFHMPEDPELQRKELELFDLQKEKLNESAGLLKSGRLPVVYAFGQLGYGNPGLNMLKDEFDSWYLVGAGISWNLWDWRSVNREKQNLSYRAEMVENKKLDLERKLNDALIRQKSVIVSHRKNIEKYKEMLEMHREITDTYQTMMQNGSIKTIDYLKVFNDERRMEIKLFSEKILFQKSIAEYKYITGNLTVNN